MTRSCTNLARFTSDETAHPRDEGRLDRSDAVLPRPLLDAREERVSDRGLAGRDDDVVGRADVRVSDHPSAFLRDEPVDHRPAQLGENEWTRDFRDPEGSAAPLVEQLEHLLAVVDRRSADLRHPARVPSCPGPHRLAA